MSSSFRGNPALQSGEDVIKAQKERSTKTLLPTEFVLALVKREIERIGRQAIFLDGFPRNLDQVSYSLFFRDLIGFRNDPDYFILIDVPEQVIDERIKHRVVCPVCQTPRNVKLLPTSQVAYDQKKKEFYLKCDNPDCRGARMVAKEGDSLGIETIRERLNADGELMRKAMALYGIPKILLRNSIPAKEAGEWVDDYEITPEYVFSWNEKKQKIETSQKPWIIKDDSGTPLVSLMAPPVTISLIKQLADLV